MPDTEVLTRTQRPSPPTTGVYSQMVPSLEKIELKIWSIGRESQSVKISLNFSRLSLDCTNNIYNLLGFRG